jgi:hypothetical protein
MYIICCIYQWRVYRVGRLGPGLLNFYLTIWFLLSQINMLLFIIFIIEYYYYSHVPYSHVIGPIFPNSYKHTHTHTHSETYLGGAKGGNRPGHQIVRLLKGRCARSQMFRIKFFKRKKDANIFLHLKRQNCKYITLYRTKRAYPNFFCCKRQWYIPILYMYV